MLVVKCLLQTTVQKVINVQNCTMLRNKDVCIFSQSIAIALLAISTANNPD